MRKLRGATWVAFAACVSGTACQKDADETPGSGSSAAAGASGAASTGATSGAATGGSCGSNGCTSGGAGAAAGRTGTGGSTSGSAGTSGGAPSTGGVSGKSASAGAGTSPGGTSAASGGANGGGTAGTGATAGAGPLPTGACAVSADRIRITEIDVGATVVNNEDEAALMPLALSPMPGGSRVAWMGNDSQVHVTTLDASDQVTGASFGLPAHDFGDIYADANGGVLLVTRDAMGGGTLNCGEPTNLCGTPPDPPIACYDMYLVRFDGTKETWATKLTDSSADLPPYSTAKDGATVYMIWWYAHHGRIAFDGANWAGYFGSAISLTQEGCINIHQGDRMKVVDASGAIQKNAGFDWGCSHSGYERILWDASAMKWVTVCKTDNDNRISFAPQFKTIYPVDLNYSNLGNIVTANGGGYWLTVSNIRDGEPPAMDGLADVHLLHFATGTADKDVVLASDAGLNDRAPHLAAYGADNLLAVWETSTKAGDLAANDQNRKLYAQSRDRTTGDAVGEPVQIMVKGNRYQEFKDFPDGSVAYAAPGSSATKLKIVRVLPCTE